MLPSGAMGIKQNVPKKYQVMANGIKYYPTARIARFNAKGELVIYCELHDLKAHSVTICPLSDVERVIKNEM